MLIEGVGTSTHYLRRMSDSSVLSCHEDITFFDYHKTVYEGFQRGSSKKNRYINNYFLKDECIRETSSYAWKSKEDRRLGEKERNKTSECQ